MPSLADLFVSLKADDKPLNRTLQRAQESLRSVDRTKVQPQITLPSRINEDIKGMSTKLQALARARVSLNVDSTTAKADVSTLERQLAQLKANRHKVPLEMSGEADRAIAQVERDLLAAQRKQTTIPLKLERVDSRIAAVKSSLAGLEKDAVDIPLDVDKQGGLRGKLAQIRSTAEASGRESGARFGLAFSSATKGMLIGAAAGGLAALGAGFGKAVGLAGNFEKSMRLVQVTSGASAKDLKSLTDTAIEMGSKTSFSAQGASDAMVALAKGGMSAANIQGGALQQTLTLATAGGLELGQAADYMVSGLTAFGLKAKDSGRVAAALAGGANASTASVESMGLALSQVAAQAATSGLSIESTSAAIAALANNGVQGSDAGTSLKVMLQRLVPQTAKASDAMKSLGLITKDGSNKFFDAQGNMKSLTEVSGLLQGALAGQSKEQKINTLYTIFGSDATRAASILAKEGAAGLAGYTKATSDKTQAERLAQSATQGFAGAMEKFKGAVETAGIQIGTVLLPYLSKLLNWLADSGLPAVMKFGGYLRDTFGPAFAASGRIIRDDVLPALQTVGSFIKDNIVVIGGFAVAIGAAVAAWKTYTFVTVGIPALLGAVRGAMIAVNVAMRANPVGLVVTAIAGLAAGLIYAYKNFEPFRNAVDTVASALKTGLLAAIDAVSGAFKRVATAATEDWASVKTAVTRAWDGIVSFFTGAGDAIVSAVSRVWAAVASGVSSAWNGIRSAVTGAWNGVVSFFTTGAAGPVVAAIGAVWKSVQSGTDGAFRLIGNVIKAGIDLWLEIIKAELAIIGTVFLLAWQGLSAVAKASFNFIKDKIIEPVWGAITGVFSAAQKVVSDAWGTFWGGVSSAASTAWTYVKDKIIAPVWSLISGLFTTYMNNVKRNFTDWWDAVKSIASAAWTFVKDKIVTPVWNSIKTIFTNAHKAVSDAWSAFWSTIKSTASAAFVFVRDKILTPIWTNIKNAWTNAQSWITTKWTEFWTAIKTGASTAFAYLRDKIIAPIWNNIKGTWDAAHEYIKDKWSRFWSGIKTTSSNAIGWVWDNISGVFGRIKSGTETFIGNIARIFGGIKDAFSAPWDWVKRNVFDRIANAYNSVARTIGAKTISLADGGPVRGSGDAGSTGSGPRYQAAADGGRIRGVGGPRQDNIAGIDRRTGRQTSWVSAGEYVVNAKAYKQNRDLVEAINASGSRAVGRALSDSGNKYGRLSNALVPPTEAQVSERADLAEQASKNTSLIAEMKKHGNAYVYGSPGGWDVPGAAQAWNAPLRGRLSFNMGAGPLTRQVTVGTKNFPTAEWRAVTDGANIALNTAPNIMDKSLGDRRSTVIHEMGHVLGLNHNTRSDSIMSVSQARLRDILPGPSTYDVNQLLRTFPAQSTGDGATGPVGGFLTGGISPLAGARWRRHTSGYGWARWAGDGNVGSGSDDHGMPIRAYKAGVVSAVKRMTTSYGNHVRMNHGAENTLYAHLSSIGVRAGQQLNAGEVLGRLGSTGNSTGDHIHFEVTGGGGSIVGRAASALNSVLEMIKPRSIFRAAASPLLRLSDAGVGALPGGKTPFGQLIARLPHKIVDILASKLPESFGVEGDGANYTSPGASGRFSAEQMRNAATVASVGSGMGRRAQIIGLITALVESNLRNVGYGDRDSVGLFQQRTPWGSRAERMNPRISASMFYHGGRGGQPGLDDIRGWQGMSLGAAAQRVQVSAFPGRYQTRVGQAESILGALKMADGGLVKGGRGGALAHIGEGRRDELVTPLPRGWSFGGGNDDKIDRLIAAIERYGLQGATINLGGINNPVAEKPSVTVNRSLQHVAALGVLG